MFRQGARSTLSQLTKCPYAFCGFSSIDFYLKAKGFSSEVAPLIVDQTKLKLQGMVSIRWHLQLGIQECGRRKRKTMGGKKQKQTEWTEVRNI